ncbi:P1 family peptidase [Oryzobacter sp. R7]|uniref:P1 family peptidase n=1 Tax=Oryzobacter faecalis TaxID=3388656 RepID=UPI00398C9607
MPPAAQPGPHNAITDVEGVRVGHATRDEPGWLTGVTVVVPPPGTVGGVDVRGGGPGSRETDLLDPRRSVDRVDAVVLSGGSAFGLGTADGVMAGLADDGRGWPVGPEPHQVVPIVPAAILFDLGRGGGWRHHPGPDDGLAAYRAAAGGPVAEGAVGAGTGAMTGGLRGGVGSASVRLASGATVGALVAVNAGGSAWDAAGRLLAAPLLLPEDGPVPPPDPAAAEAHRLALEALFAELRAGRATTLGVVATDATLTKAACQLLAGVAHDGFARALSPVHTVFDGDAVFALSTRTGPEPDRFDLVDLQSAAADATARAIARAVLAASSVDRSADGGAVLRSYRDALTTVS